MCIFIWYEPDVSQVHEESTNVELLVSIPNTGNFGFGCSDRTMSIRR